MKRIPEPELMEDPEQAAAYANADFEEPHSKFIEYFRQRFPDDAIRGNVLDLGCGPADITIRFARAFPNCTLAGVDGAASMLAEGEKAVNRAGLQDRITLINTRLPGAKLPHANYTTIISNSLLHHLHDPPVLWETIKQYSEPGTRVFIMDLMRPETDQEAKQLVDTYAAEEPAILQRDFYHSLKAAFVPQEVSEQLQHADLGYLTVEPIPDRHLLIYGYCK